MYGFVVTLPLSWPRCPPVVFLHRPAVGASRYCATYEALWGDDSKAKIVATSEMSLCSPKAPSRQGAFKRCY